VKIFITVALQLPRPDTNVIKDFLYLDLLVLV